MYFKLAILQSLIVFAVCLIVVAESAGDRYFTEPCYDDDECRPPLTCITEKFGSRCRCPPGSEYNFPTSMCVILPGRKCNFGENHAKCVRNAACLFLFQGSKMGFYCHCEDGTEETDAGCFKPEELKETRPGASTSEDDNLVDKVKNFLKSVGLIFIIFWSIVLLVICSCICHCCSKFATAKPVVVVRRV